ncbi:unannotated protein [freshwater metagenome]|uniref:Unannotated protein n=1 Tax=freshwater metagenome TaxID=449393 RepID=A0A6J6NGC6_9ZZZZ
MDFVDEQHDVATCLDFFQNLLETLFEVTAVTATCNKCAKVKCVELLVFQSFRNVTRNNFLCETFNDGGFTNTRFTDKNRVVLCAARKNLHHAFKFASTTNDRVKFFLTSQLSEVATELVENLASTFFAWLFFVAWGCCTAGWFTFGARTLVARQQLNDLLTNFSEVCTQLHKNLSCNAFTFAKKSEKNVLGADVVMT